MPFLKILLIFVMTFSGTLGAYYLKKTIAKIEKISIKALLLSPSLYIGGFCYVVGAVINIVLLGMMEYTILYPMTSLTYIWTLIFSYFVLKEKITLFKIVAIAFVTAGVIVIAL